MAGVGFRVTWWHLLCRPASAAPWIVESTQAFPTKYLSICQARWSLLTRSLSKHTLSPVCMMEYPSASNPASSPSGPPSLANRSEPKIDPLPVGRRPFIGFRVEGSDAVYYPGKALEDVYPTKGCWFNNERFSRPRECPSWPWSQPSAEEFRAHLVWDPSTPSTLVSFYTTWEAALRRRGRFIEWGATNVTIYAVWLYDHEFVYDACEVAQQVAVSKNPAFFKDEVLVLGGIAHRIVLARVGWGSVFFQHAYQRDELISFDGLKDLEDVSFSFGAGTRRREARIPVGRHPPDKEAVLRSCLVEDMFPEQSQIYKEELKVNLDEWRADAYTKLRSEMNEGCWGDDFKATILALALSGSSYTVRDFGSEKTLVCERLPSGNLGSRWLFHCEEEMGKPRLFRGPDHVKVVGNAATGLHAYMYLAPPDRFIRFCIARTDDPGADLRDAEVKVRVHRRV